MTVLGDIASPARAGGSAPRLETGRLVLRAPGGPIDRANRRSIRLAERLGAVRDDACARPDAGALVCSRPVPEAVR